MRKSIILLVAAVSCGLTTGAMAQSAPKIDRHVAQMRRMLHLSGQQAGTIRADYFAASDEKKAIRHNRNLSPMDRQARIREVTRSTNHQIEAVLSPMQAGMWHRRARQEVW